MKLIPSIKNRGILDTLSERVNNSLQRGEHIAQIEDQTAWYEAAGDREEAKAELKKKLAPNAKPLVCPF